MENKLVVYIDMDDTMFDFSGRYNEMLERYPENKYPQSQYGFFENLAPTDGAIRAFNKLLLHDNFDPYILTAPSEMNPLCYTEKRNSVHKHLGDVGVNRLIISPHKHLSCGDILIDDKRSGKGQDKFQGVLLQFGSKKYPDWKAIEEFLEI